MDFSQFETVIRWVLTSSVTSSPLTFAALTGLATAFVWLAVAPTRTQAQKDGRLDGYLHGRDIIEDLDMSRSFLIRVVVPALRKGLDSLAALSPGRDVRRVQQMLVEAGEPGGLTAPDIFGLQILSAVGLVALYLLVVRTFGFLTVDGVARHASQRSPPGGGRVFAPPGVAPWTRETAPG